MSTRTTICNPAEVLAYLGKAGTASEADLGLVTMLLPMTDAAIKSFLGYQVVQASYTHMVPDVDMFSVSQNDIGLPVDVINNHIAYAFPGPQVILQLPEIPVRSIQTFAMDYSALGGQGATDFAAATDITQGTQYYIDYDCPDPGQVVPYRSGISWTGHVRAWIGVFSGRQRTMQVTYTAGFSPDELDGKTALGYRNCTDIKFAAILTAVAAFREAKSTGVNFGAQGPIVSEKIGDAAFTYDKESVAQMTGMMRTMPFKAEQLLRPHQRVKR
jgi:hypothetical protein